MIVRFAQCGDIVGHRGLSMNWSSYPISATAMQNTVVSFISMEVFKTLLKTNNSFTYALMLFYAEELQWSEQKSGSFVHLSVKERLVFHLSYLKKQFGEDENGFLKIDLTKTDVAAYVGTTYESVYREILELEREEILQFCGKKIKFCV